MMDQLREHRAVELSNPLRGDGTVQLNTIVDSSKVRDMPIIADEVYNRGLEWYAYHKHVEAPMDIGPSIHQFTAILELTTHRSMYVDLGHLKPTISAPPAVIDGPITFSKTVP